MKISELVDILLGLQEQHGDREVESYNGYGTAAPDPELCEDGKVQL